MNPVEQAVFTSAETSRTAGYQLVAKSEGVSEEDARTLSAWGPSHGALLNSGRQASSVNFYPLPSGNYCVSRTTASGNEYSGRGTRIYTQCLVVSPETSKHFANNPFAMVRAASGSGLLKQYEKVPANLKTVALVGRAPVVDPSLLSRARRELGPEPIARLVQEALQCTSMAIAGTSSGDLAVAALLNCLPPQIRSEFSFSTGLRTSARRPFRLLVLGDDAEEQRRVRQIDEVTFIDFSDKAATKLSLTNNWARAIHQILETGRTSLLSRWFENLSEAVSVDQLNAMGPDLLEELASSTVPGSGTPFPPANISNSRSDKAPSDDMATKSSDETTPSSNPQAPRQLAHAAHARFSATSAAEERIPGPSAALSSEHPQVVATLETLDDLVYDAIKGDDSSLDQLRTAWPRLRMEMGDELLTQSREQYLRYALHVWEKCVEASSVRPTDQAVNALEVLCLLFDEV
jgi:GTPase-associated protein 1